jgi:hypothetical protein
MQLKEILNFPYVNNLTTKKDHKKLCFNGSMNLMYITTVI